MPAQERVQGQVQEQEQQQEQAPVREPARRQARVLEPAQALGRVRQMIGADAYHKAELPAPIPGWLRD